MAKNPKSKYSASESLQGYLYQCRHALLLFLQRNRAAPSVRISVEKFDDVAFEGAGQPRELIQTKHRTQPGNLTDLSEDLWKTLRIWSEGVRDKNFPLPGTVFTLITTQTAPDGAAAAMLRPDAGRDPAKADGLLVAAAKATANVLLKDACDTFLTLPARKRRTMLADVYVHDASVRIADLDQRLLQEVHYAALDHRAAFLEQLEGWWYRRVIRHLTTTHQPPIRGVELEREMARLQDGFTEDNLPIEIPLPEPPTPPDPTTDPRDFVARLRKIGVPSGRIRKAILDFYRAYVHRDRWAKDTLLRFQELEQYDERLHGEWERLCDDLLAELAGAGDDEKEKLGRELFQRIDNDAARETVFFIRPRCTEPSISRGTFHKLADEGKVAWHPEDANAVRAQGAGPPQGSKP